MKTPQNTLSLRSLSSNDIHLFTRHQLVAGTVPNSICTMDSQRKTSAASIEYPEQTLGSLFLTCVSGNPEITNFRESLIKFIQKKNSIIMSAIIAKQLTPELDTQRANTCFFRISLYRVFLRTTCFHKHNSLLGNTHWD